MSTITCAACPPLAGCPQCNAGEMCQMSVPASCLDCPVNKCIADPSYRPSSNKSKVSGIAGGLFGVIIALAILAALYSVYQKKQRRKDRIAEANRFAEKLKAAEEEKFRPGAGKGNNIGGDFTKSSNAGQRRSASDGLGQDDGYSITMGQANSSINSRYGRGGLDDDEEWTELREDGHTTISMLGESAQGDTVFAGYLLRQSAGAATHLSRITEGLEEEEEQQKQRASQQRFPNNNNTPTIREEAAIEMRSLASNKTWSITNVNPFIDTTENVVPFSGQQKSSAHSKSYHFEIGQRWSAMTGVEVPSPVHRPLGSPIVAVPNSASPKMPSASKLQLYSPSRPKIRSPTYTANSPDWNVPLSKGKDGQTNPNENSPSKVFGFSSSELHEEETMSYSVYESIEEEGNQPNTIRHLNPNDASNRLSIVSTSTISSVAYSMMSPQIVTQSDKGGIQRLKLTQGKAQLVRVNSEKKADKKSKEIEVIQEGQIRQRKSHSVSMLDSILDVDVKSLNSPFPNNKVLIDSKNKSQDGDRSIGDESGLDPVMNTTRQSMMQKSKTESLVRNDSFGLRPFRKSHNHDDDNVEGFLRRCTSDGDRHDSNATISPSDYARQQEEEQRHERDLLRGSNSTITGLSVLDDIPFELSTSSDVTQELTETLKPSYNASKSQHKRPV